MNLYLRPLLCLFSLLASLYLAAQNDYWKKTGGTDISLSKRTALKNEKDGDRIFFNLDKNVFWKKLEQAPAETARQANAPAFVIYFPNAEGQMEPYQVAEAPSMSEALSEKYPGIRSFAGTGISDPQATIRFDISPFGLHGMILKAGMTPVYINPSDEEGLTYEVVSKKDIASGSKVFSCITEEEKFIQSVGGNINDALSARNADDGKRRTYRLALAASGEFSQHFITAADITDAQKKQRVLAVQNTHVTRLNAIYEKELSIRFQLINNNDAIIYLDPATDPWTNEWNTKTQETIDAVIGAANYDLGHLEHKDNDNGNAGCIGCVCVAGRKGRGFTALFNPSQEDVYVIDYLSHEIGHQFGAYHTYTAEDESTGRQVEPGSGSTIMGYAGITGPGTDIQNNSDDYFHSISIEQISGYAKNTGCAAVTLTGNTAPASNAGQDYIIPASTPFTLTGSATDINGGDVLTYAWEEMDPYGSGSSSIPAAGSTSGPQFRSYKPVNLPFRNFPILSSILDGTNRNKWEVLPSAGRTLHFRFTTRDNNLAGGNNSSDDMTITIAPSAGPFLVTAPNTAVTWRAGYLEPVTWDVKGTDAVPVSATHVNILLSTDGGQTFPVTLLSNTPNDGSALVNVPSNLSSNCRIKVMAANNIFFDINNASFTIAANQPGFDFSEVADVTLGCGGQTSASASLNVLSVSGYSTPVQLTASNVPGGAIVSFSANTVIPGQPVTVTLNNTNALPAGIYTITVNGTSGSLTRSRNISFKIFQGQSPEITRQPAAAAICEGGTTAFTVAATNAINYQWQVSNNDGNSFTNLGGANATLPTLVFDNTAVSFNGNLYRAVITGQCNSSTSAAALLTVNALPTVSLNASPLNSLQPGETTLITANINEGSGNIVLIEWLFNGNVLADEHDNTLEADVDGIGTYQLRITDENGCISTSTVLPITAKESEQLFIYPNPNNGEFGVSFYNKSGDIKQTIAVYNAVGAQVYFTSLPVSSYYQLHEIKLTHLQKGVYFVVLGNESGKKLKAGKVVIQ